MTHNKDRERDLKRELEEQGDNWPPAWNPEPGETLVGRVILFDQGYTPYGPVRTALIEAERDDGSRERVSLWLNSTVLLSLFERDKPLVGERIGIRYLGKHETKGYRRYRLLVDRDPARVSFSPLGGEREGGPAAADDDPAAFDPFAEEDDGEATPYAREVVSAPGARFGRER